MPRNTATRARVQLVVLKPPPETRAGCADMPRPCDCACIHNNQLVLPGERKGRRWLARPGKPGQPTLAVVRRRITPACALDVTEEHPEGLSQRETAKVLGMSQTNLRRHEASGLAKLRAAGVILEIARTWKEVG